MKDFSLSAEKTGDYYISVRKVLTNIFGDRCVHAYVTASNKTTMTRRLFFSTIAPESICMACAWQEKSPLNQTCSEWMQYVPLFVYSFRWNIEVSYYEQKNFWSLSAYMIRSKKGIETLVNLINISYCAMKILSYKDETFSAYKNSSAQCHLVKQIFTNKKTYGLLKIEFTQRLYYSGRFQMFYQKAAVWGRWGLSLVF